MSKRLIPARTNPLIPDEKAAWFRAHMPYLRASLTNHIRLSSDPGLFGSMRPEERRRVTICTYEIGVVTCRKFIEFPGLSIAYNPYRLIEKRDYYPAKEDGNAYEVKVIDLGGTWSKSIR